MSINAHVYKDQYGITVDSGKEEREHQIELTDEDELYDLKAAIELYLWKWSNRKA